jgi:hypothetical protein
MNQPLKMTDKTGLQTEEADDVISVTTTAFDSFKDYVKYAIDHGMSIVNFGQANRATTYYTGGEQDFEQRVGSSRVSRDLTTIANPLTAPAFKGANRRFDKVEPYLDVIPIVGTGKDLAKSIVMSGGRDNKGILTKGALFAVDFGTSLSGIAGGGIKAVGKVGFRAAAEEGGRAIALGRKEFVYDLADKTSSFAYRSWNKEGLAKTSVFSNFPRAFNEASTTAARINFSLDGILFGEGVEKAVQAGGRNAWRPGFMTSTELNRVYTNPSLFQKTDFFFQNRPVSPLFRPQF